MGAFLDTAWRGLGEQPDALALVTEPAQPVPLTSTLPVGALVRDAVAAASLSASLLAARHGRRRRRPGRARSDPDRHRGHERAALPHRRRAAGRLGAPLRLLGDLRRLGAHPRQLPAPSRAPARPRWASPDDTDADGFRSHLAGRTADEVESLVAAAGGVATVVRTEAEWRAHPQRGAVAETPFIGLRRMADAPPGKPGPVRVLDLTRVIAGPVATRTLALWGFDVLRIDGPQHPELELQHLDTGNGKRSAILDLDAGLRPLRGAARPRPTSSSPATAAGPSTGSASHRKRSPSAIPASWSPASPPGARTARSRERRGFDSIVQAATGIAWLESLDASPPRPTRRASRPGARPLRRVPARCRRSRQHCAAASTRAEAGWSRQPRAGRPGVARRATLASRRRRAVRAHGRHAQDQGEGDVTSALPAAPLPRRPGRLGRPTRSVGFEQGRMEIAPRVSRLHPADREDGRMTDDQPTADPEAAARHLPRAPRAGRRAAHGQPRAREHPVGGLGADDLGRAGQLGARRRPG